MRRLVLPALLLLICLPFLPALDLKPLPEARAQPAPIAYRLSETFVLEPRPPSAAALDWPAGHLPGGMDVDPVSGQIFATDRSAGSIRVYDSGGGFVEEIRAPAGRTALDRPRDLAVLFEPPHDLAVSDSGNDRVLVLSQSGSVVAAIDVPDPAGIAPALEYDQDGVDFYVLSTSRHRIYGYRRTGEEILSIPLDGSISPEGLSHPEVLAIRAPGTDYRRFMVADPGAGLVRDMVYMSGGIRSDEKRPLAGVRAVEAGLAVSTGAGAALELHSFGGAPGIGVARLELPDPLDGALPFAEVWDIDMDARGAMFALVEPQGLVDLGNAGTLALRMQFADGELRGAERIAAGSSLLLADASPFLQRVSLAGQPAGRYYELSPSLPPVDVAMAGSGRYYLSNSELVGGRAVKALGPDGRTLARWQANVDNAHRLEAVSADGERLAVLDLLGQEVNILAADLRSTARWSISSGAFKGVLDLAISPQRVFLANQQAGTLEIFREDGTRLGVVEVPTGPLRLAARDDDVVLVLTGADWIFAYGPGGERLGAWPAGLPQEQPVDLDVGEDGRLYVLDASGEIRVYTLDPDAEAQLPPPAGPERCAVLRDKGAAPREIMLGETVEVSLVVDGTCPIEYKSADVVLTIDTSGSMGQESKMSAARDAAIAFLAQTDPLLTRIGLVSFAGEPRIVMGLSDDRRQGIAAVNGLQAEGGTRLVPPLQASIDMLTGADARAGASPVVVFMSDGKDTGGGSQQVLDPEGLSEAIQRARDAGVFIFTIGLGSDADERTLRRMASDGDAYFFSPSAAELRGVYLQIARRIEAAELFQTVTVVDELPDNMRFVPGTGQPVEPALSPDGKTLSWQLAPVYEPGFRLSYRLQPEEAGLWPTNRRAWADFVDGFGHAGQVVFPVPEVLVRGPTATPTATPLPSATPRPLRPVYLPLLVRERCTGHRLHILLAVDTSSSMRASFGPDGESKMDAARRAASSFLAGVDLERDAMTILGFDAEARILASGQDRAALEAGVRALASKEGTRIDRALQLAAENLSGPARLPASRAVVILLSDGAPTAGSERASLDAAEALRSLGVELHTVAVGRDAARDFLRELAGDPARARFADDGAALRSIYAALAEALAPCVPSWLSGAEGRDG